MAINRTAREEESNSIIDRIKKSRQAASGKISAIFKENASLQFYRPDYGKHLIDIIPYKAGNNDIYSEKGEKTYTYAYLMHYTGPAKISVICPSMYNKPCPICEMISNLEYDDFEDQKIYKMYSQKRRNLYNVIVHDSKEERKKGIQIFDQAEFYFEKGLRSIAIQAAREGGEEKIVDFTHKKKGKSIQFENIKKTSKDGFDTWTGHTFQERNYTIDKDILKQAYCLDELVQILSYEEIKSILDGSLQEHNDNNSDNQTENSIKIDFEEIIRQAKNEVEDNDDLEEISDKFDLEDIGFDGINIDEDFESEKKKLISFCEMKLGKEKHSKKQTNKESIDKDQIISKIKEAEDNDDLEEIVEDFDLEKLGFEEIDEDSEFKDEKKRLKNWVKNYEEPNNSGEDSSPFDKDKILDRIKAVKTISEIKSIIDDFNIVDLGYNDFDIDNKPSKERIKLKKFIKNYEPVENIFTKEKLMQMTFEALSEIVSNRFSDDIDIDDFDEDDIDDLTDEILEAYNYEDVPF